MHFYVFVFINVLCSFKGAYSAGCNCGLGPGINPCLAGGGILNTDSIINVGGGGGVYTSGGSFISSGGSIHSSGGGSSGVYPQIVRPQVLPPVDVGSISKPRVVCKTIGGTKPLQPIGDLCSVGNTVVKPAIIPRPACAGCSLTSSSSSQQSQRDLIQSLQSGTGYGPHGTLLSGAGSLLNAAAGSGGFSGGSALAGSPLQNFKVPLCGLPEIIRPRKTHSNVAADAVSLQIAAAKQRELAAVGLERKMQIVFDRLPKEVPCEKKVKNSFPEHLLYKQNGDVLQAPTYSSGPALSVDDEAEAELREAELDAEEEERQVVPAIITLGDLQYAPVKDEPKQFTNVDVSLPGGSCGSDGLIGSDDFDDSGVLTDGGRLGLVANCRDGYKSGQVIIQHGPVASQVVAPESPEPICLRGEEQRGSVYSYSQSHSSSNIQNQQSSLQLGLGCS